MWQVGKEAKLPPSPKDVSLLFKRCIQKSAVHFLFPFLLKFPPQMIHELVQTNNPRGPAVLGVVIGTGRGKGHRKYPYQ